MLLKNLEFLHLRRYNRRMNASFALISLGCAKNQVDSEHMVGCMLDAGFRQVEPGEADILIINTCGFIDPAKEEAINTIFDAVRTREAGDAPAEQQIIVAGCLSQRYAQELAKEMPEVACFMGVDEISRVAEIATACLNGTAQKIYTTRVSTYLPDWGCLANLSHPRTMPT